MVEPITSDLAQRTRFSILNKAKGGQSLLASKGPKQKAEPNHGKYDHKYGDPDFFSPLLNGQAGNDHRDTQGHEDHYEDYPYLHILPGFTGSGFPPSPKGLRRGTQG
jgi:hypothetical protein